MKQANQSISLVFLCKLLFVFFRASLVIVEKNLRDVGSFKCLHGFFLKNTAHSSIGESLYFFYKTQGHIL